MVSPSITLALAAMSFHAAVHANPVSYYNASISRPSSSAADCVPYLIPLTVTSENYVFNLTKFSNNLDVASLSANVAGSDFFHPVAGLKNETATYTVSATFCSPKEPAGGREKTVLLATHGLAYDGQYWDSAYLPEEYSFVENMVARGYSVFYYDRIGTGSSQMWVQVLPLHDVRLWSLTSSHSVSGYTNQGAPQIEIAAQLATLIRNGSYTGAIGPASSIVLVGHSFGSYVSNSIMVKYPNVADAAVLTGQSYAPDACIKDKLAVLALRISSELDPLRYPSYDSGYLSSADIAQHTVAFFKAPYELEAALYAYSITAPTAIGEFLSGDGDSVAPRFTGPVLIANGEFDLAECHGSCVAAFAKQKPNEVFPKSRLVETLLHPRGGHGVNFARNASDFYAGIAGFLERAGY
jgi:pimeloyl-ACP methyl ester carboxylesterase